MEADYAMDQDDMTPEAGSPELTTVGDAFDNMIGRGTYEKDLMMVDVDRKQSDCQSIDLEPGEVMGGSEDGCQPMDQGPLEIVEMGVITGVVTIKDHLQVGGESIDQQPVKILDIAEVNELTCGMDEDDDGDIQNSDGHLRGEPSTKLDCETKDGQLTTDLKVTIRSLTGQLSDQSGNDEDRDEDGDSDEEEEDHDDDDDDDDKDADNHNVGADGSSSMGSKRTRKNMRISNSCYRKRRCPAPPSHSSNVVVLSRDEPTMVQTVCYLHAATLHRFMLTFMPALFRV